jgi:hypothetical protein
MNINHALKIPPLFKNTCKMLPMVVFPALRKKAVVVLDSILKQKQKCRPEFP